MSSEKQSEPLLVAVSPFGSSAEVGHPVDDDEFYFNYLVAKKREFVFYAARYSAERLSRLYPDSARYIRVIQDSDNTWRGCIGIANSVDVPEGCKLVFFGYSEKLVAAFRCMKRGTHYFLTLVATNNFSARRVRLYRWYLWGFFIAVRSKLHRLVVHTKFEQNAVQKLAAPFRMPVVVKKHHLMIPSAQEQAVKSPEHARAIAYFGPSKPEKPIDPVMALIRGDRQMQFSYRLYGLKAADASRIRNEFGDDPRIAIRNEMLSRAKYLEEFSRATLVMLTHTTEFEGKLSGNLCDCIALGIPFIGSTIEPHIEYQRRYGQIGFLENLADERWIDRFLGEINAAVLDRCRQNLRTAAGEFTLLAIHQNLDECL